jgi:hypothetical protein
LVYELRNYWLSAAGAALFQRGFEEELVPVLRDHGFDLVGAWTIEVGEGPRLVWMLRWPDLAAREVAYTAIRADERNAQFRRRHLEHLVRVESEIMNSIPASPLD